MELDDVDWDLLALLQTDASLSNLALAERTGVSPPTALRRVRRLHEAGLIMRTVALLDEDRLAALQGHGLSALAEVSLDRQGAEHQDAFERRAVLESAVQQCWRVAPGPSACSPRTPTCATCGHFFPPSAPSSSPNCRWTRHAPALRRDSRCALARPRQRASRVAPGASPVS